MRLIFFVAACAALLCSIMLIRYQHLHAHLTADTDLTSVQKFHATPVPRIGGVAILIGLIAGVIIIEIQYQLIMGFILLLVSLPAFLAGFIEDMTKKIGPSIRLYATFFSAALGFFLLGASLNRLDIPFCDAWLQHSTLYSLLFSMFAVGGVAHAMNIIDGYNGLAGVVAMLIFSALSFVAFQVGDFALSALCLAACGAILGFLMLNFPLGLIFLGDGGAYLVGFLIAEISVLLITRHPEVSPWFPFLLVIYPVFETLFSIYRKKILRGMSPGLPDGLHLHMLIYKRLVRWMVGSKDAKHLTLRNSMTAPYLWTLTALSIAPAIHFWNNTDALIICVLLFIALYLCIYHTIIRFKFPGWLKVRGGKNIFKRPRKTFISE